MTAQEIFDTVVSHLREQGTPAKNEHMRCCFRTPEGKKCAIGCLIPDEAYRSVMESYGSARSLLLYYDDWWTKGWKENLVLLEDLQAIHDRAYVNLKDEPIKWELQFERLAKIHGLEYRAA